jgi:hypothetical protein
LTSREIDGTPKIPRDKQLKPHVSASGAVEALPRRTRPPPMPQAAGRQSSVQQAKTAGSVLKINLAGPESTKPTQLREMDPLSSDRVRPGNVEMQLLIPVTGVTNEARA